MMACRALSSAMIATSLVALPAFELRADESVATEFCIDGEFDLGARLQGMYPVPGEFSAARWCVISEGGSERVYFHARGRSNPDMEGEFAVAYLPPDLVRIVNHGASPDIEFDDAAITSEAARNRRIDPVRLLEEIDAHPEWASAADDGWRDVRYPGEAASVRIKATAGRLRELRTTADLPLRGRVPVHWTWQWPPRGDPSVSVAIDGAVMFRGQAGWRELDAEDSEAFFRSSPGQDPVHVPGDAWPARVDMQLETLADGVHLVRGVRTGFQHLVVETGEGLVIADAPAGWVEVQQIPPADLVPGLGISGLSQRFIDYLATTFPGRSIRAVTLTHAHDDHAGGARAFAAAGAEVYAPAEIGGFLEEALNREAMPDDRLSAMGARVAVKPVAQRVTLDGDRNSVRLLALGPGPHVSSSLGVWVDGGGIFFQSDLHVPNSEAESPRADRSGTECWFADWAAQHLPADTIVVNSHTAPRTPVARLARYLDTDACQSAPPASATNSPSNDATASSPQ